MITNVFEVIVSTVLCSFFLLTILFPGSGGVLLSVFFRFANFFYSLFDPYIILDFISLSVIFVAVLKSFIYITSKVNHYQVDTDSLHTAKMLSLCLFSSHTGYIPSIVLSYFSNPLSKSLVHYCFLISVYFDLLI